MDMKKVIYLWPKDKELFITCLPKEGKSKFYIKNWHPISLWNVDYKICSSSIAQRLKQVLQTIISETQVGFMKGRYIGVPN